MMEKNYQFDLIEEKWQKLWETNNFFKSYENADLPKY